METITITIPKEAAYKLLELVIDSCNTGDEKWDNHMSIIEKKLNEKL